MRLSTSIFVSIHGCHNNATKYLVKQRQPPPPPPGVSFLVFFSNFFSLLLFCLGQSMRNSARAQRLEIGNDFCEREGSLFLRIVETFLTRLRYNKSSRMFGGAQTKLSLSVPLFLLFPVHALLFTRGQTARRFPPYIRGKSKLRCLKNKGSAFSELVKLSASIYLRVQ